MHYQSYNPTATAKPSARDSVDSADFKDCMDHNENLNYQSNPPLSTKNHRRVPSALKGNSNSSLENGNYDGNSRHTSKSVRFESN